MKPILTFSTFSASLALIMLAACVTQPPAESLIIYETEAEAFASPQCALKNPGDERLVLPYGDGFTCEIQNGN
jgi:hypothetical protein